MGPHPGGLGAPSGGKARRLVVVGIAGLLLATPLTAVGCGDDSDASQTQVIVTTSTVPSGSGEASQTITPLERGKIRREVIAVAQAAVDAWLTDDLEAMREYFAPSQMEYFQDLHDTYVQEKKQRVRSHSATSIDVTAINNDATEATVEYYFNDDSYFADEQGTALTEPTHKQTMIQFTLVKDDNGDWMIERIFGANENLA